MLISGGTDGPARALLKLHRSLNVQRVCVSVSDRVRPAGFLLYFTFINLLHALCDPGFFFFFLFNMPLYTLSDAVTLNGAVSVMSSWSLAHLFAPLTLNSLIPLERLFAAKLMFANTQSCHTHTHTPPNPTSPFCMCVFVGARLCTYSWS